MDQRSYPPAAKESCLLSSRIRKTEKYIITNSIMGTSTMTRQPRDNDLGRVALGRGINAADPVW